jgi:hypothetical protein
MVRVSKHLPEKTNNYPFPPGACLPCTITVQGLPEVPPCGTKAGVRGDIP